MRGSGESGHSECGVRGEGNIVNVGSGETGYSECGVRESGYSECGIRG
ncbi:unnamed protein product [Staurois parvus]|uniref:Uncharacterized protein n=1 Tax=Staurois parvus TaxID=386267 RepID=A0ABN9HXC8_9NEOB|nr:unnamed protein product [Staurois parvus]